MEAFDTIKAIWGQLDGIIVAVLAILGGFSALAKFTPTKADDAILQKAIDFIHLLGLTKKK